MTFTCASAGRITLHKAAATSEEIGSKTFKSWRLNKPRLFYHSVLSVCQEFQRRSIADSPHGLGGGLGRGLGVVEVLSGVLVWGVVLMGMCSGGHVPLWSMKAPGAYHRILRFTGGCSSWRRSHN